MPSPRSVLSDIHDLGLDPKRKYSDVNASGRLKVSAPAEQAQVAEVVCEVPAVDVAPVDETVETAETAESTTEDLKPEETPKEEKKRGRKPKADVSH